MLTSAINQKFRMTTAWGAVGLRPRCLPGLYVSTPTGLYLWPPRFTTHLCVVVLTGAREAVFAQPMVAQNVGRRRYQIPRDGAQRRSVDD